MYIYVYMYFPSSRSQKIKLLQKLGIQDCFCLLSEFHFLGISHAKTNLHNQYMNIEQHIFFYKIYIIHFTKL